MNNFINVEQMIKAIDLASLSNIIKDNYNIQATFELTELDEYGFRIQSNNLQDQTGNIGLLMFKEIFVVVTCGRDRISQIKNDYLNNNNDNNYYFSLDIRYNHLNSGSNGVNLGRGFIGYKFENNKWVIPANN